MSKMWKIIKYEYKRHVLRKRFLLALLSVPLWIVVMVVVIFLAVVLTNNNTPIGYVDHSGLLANPVYPEPEEASPFPELEIIAYADEESARKALDDKKLQAFFVLPPEYLVTRDVKMVYLEEPNDNARGEFSDFLRANLLTDVSPEIVERVSEGSQLVIHATEENRQVENNNLVKIIAPIAAGILLIISVFTSGGYLMQAVVEEKENRTMEIMATSVSPMQIMGGKVLALIGVGLTQVLVWSIFPLVGVAVASNYFPFLRNGFDWGLVGLIFVLVVPTFVLMSALMAAIGATVTEASEGQAVSGWLSIPVWIPYMLMGVLIANPGSPISLFLSFFPLTAALTVLIRIGFSTVPAWQIWVSAVILFLSAGGALWFAGRVFRLGMLQYGKRLGWKDIFRSMKTRSA